MDFSLVVAGCCCYSWVFHGWPWNFIAHPIRRSWHGLAKDIAMITTWILAVYCKGSFMILVQESWKMHVRIMHSNHKKHTWNFCPKSNESCMFMCKKLTWISVYHASSPNQTCTSKYEYKCLANRNKSVQSFITMGLESRHMNHPGTWILGSWHHLFLVQTCSCLFRKENMASMSRSR